MVMAVHLALPISRLMAPMAAMLNIKETLTLKNLKKLENELKVLM